VTIAISTPVYNTFLYVLRKPTQHCPDSGKQTSDMWFDDLSVEQKKEINKRVIMDKRTIPDVLDDDSHHACPIQTDTEISYQQITSGGISWPPTGEFTFTGTQQTLSNTPHTTDYAFYCKSQNTTHSASEDPPDHTISIEANIRASGKEKSVSLDNFWRHRILTSCGEDRVSRGDKHVDPALCMYYGVKFICVMDNTALCQRVPRENGTMCRFRSIKLKPGASSVRTKFFHGRKVTTVNAKDVQYMECEVIDNSSHIKQLARRIKELSLKPRPDTKKSKTPLTD
jgi:hypothetical protein